MYFQSLGIVFNLNCFNILETGDAFLSSWGALEIRKLEDLNSYPAWGSSGEENENLSF